MKLGHFFSEWQALSPAGKVLIVNGFTFNLGFYMLLPYLADHLQQDLSLAGWIVGLVLGLRVLSQQGLFLVGGTLGDYWGYRKTILLGCLIRTIGFILLGVSHHVYGLLLGAFLTGFAGALFTPSSQAYLASEYPEQSMRNRVFALQNLSSEAGMLLGPLVGLALLAVSFFWIGWVAGGAFFLLFLIQWYFLPEHQGQKTEKQPAQHFLSQWASMLNNRSFLVFILWASTYQVLFHQLYLAIPTTIRVLTDDARLITWVFMVSSLLGVCLQLPISRLVQEKLGGAVGMGLGMSLMGVAFLPLLSVTPGFVAVSLLMSAALLSVGSMLVFPLLGAWVPRYASPVELASYYGLYACVGGLAAFLGNIIVGWTLPVSGAPSAWLWLGLCLLGLVSGLMLYTLVRQNYLASGAR